MATQNSAKILLAIEQLMYQNPKTDMLRCYYASLRTAILDEVQSSGRCTMIEQILYEKKSRIPMVAFKALTDVYDHIFREYPLGQIRESYIYYPMRHEEFTISIDYMNIDMQYFQNISSEFERHYKNSKPRSAMYGIRFTSSGKRQDKSGVSGCPLAATERSSAAQSAEQEAIRSANEKAAAILRKAEEDAAKIRGTAEEEYQKRVEQAKQLCTDAEHEAHRCMQEAMEKHNALVASAEQDARNAFEAQKQKLLDAYFAQQQQRMNEIAAQNQQKQEETAAAAEQQLSIMSDEVSRLQANLVDTVTQASDALSKLKLDMCTKMSDWRTDLYRAKYRSLIHSYLSLYHLGKQNVSQKLKNAVQLPEISDPEMIRQQTNELTNQIKSIYEQISLLCRMMENAMAELGILVYFPKEGDTFDAYLHVRAETDAAEGDLITACAVPGIRIAGEQGSVIYQAQVEVTNHAQNNRTYCS